MSISIIAAFSQNRVIGKNGSIPWNIPGEQNRFKNLTVENVVIMGRKTFDEILEKLSKPLPFRINIIISSTKKYSFENCFVFSTLQEALVFSKEKFPDKEIFIAGGAQLYAESISIAQKMYLTEIDIKVQGDAFFPIFDEKKFEKEINQIFAEPIPYRYVTYSRKEID